MKQQTESLIEMKQQIDNYIEEHSDAIITLSTKIYDNPELAFEEYIASQTLADFLEGYGFEVEKPYGGLETAFAATYSHGSGGLTIGVLAEYDALANGHACGHNIIAASGAAAGIAVKEMLQKHNLDGTVKVIGTPAEEEGGGKIIILDNGGFDDIDAALLLHPTTGVSKVAGNCRSSHNFDVTFTGVESSAISRPERGINASEASVLLHQTLGSAMRYLPSDVLIMPFITETDYKNGLLPSNSEVKITITADEDESIEKAVKRVKEIIEGVSLITGAKYEIKDLGGYAGRIINETVGNLLRENMINYGEEIQDGFIDDNGFEDFGNVNRVIPGMMVYPTLMKEEKVSNHTQRFLELSDPSVSADVIKLGAKVMAATAIDMIENPEIVEQAKKELEK